MFAKEYTEFIDEIYNQIQKLGIDSSRLVLDHLGYQTNSSSDFEEKVSAITPLSTKVSESIVGGRRVNLFKLNEPLEYKGGLIDLVEIFEPREGQTVESAWEHIEFTVEGSLEDFMSNYPQIEWDTTMLNRDEFPMLILKLGNGLRAKFPRLGVLAEIKRQKLTN